MSQAEVATAAGVHKNTIQRWESGDEKSPQEPQLRAVANVLGTDVVWLREGGAEKPPRVREPGGLDHGPYPGVTATGAAKLELGAKGYAQVGEVGTAGLLRRLRLAVASLQGVIAELERGGEVRRLYLPMGQAPINQGRLDHLDAELVESWWGRAG